MFKNLAALSIATLLASSSLNGDLFDGQEARLEVRASAFFPSKHSFRRAFQNTLPCYGVEATQSLGTGYDAFVNMDYFSKSKSGCCCKNDIKVLNSSFGLKTNILQWDNFEAYLGLGIAFAGVSLKSKTCCGHDHYRKVAIGGVLKSGVYYNFSEPYYLNLFVDYVYQPLNVHGEVDIGGVKTGLGLGMRF